MLWLLHHYLYPVTIGFVNYDLCMCSDPLIVAHTF